MFPYYALCYMLSSFFYVIGFASFMLQNDLFFHRCFFRHPLLFILPEYCLYMFMTLMQIVGKMSGLYNLPV